MTLTAEAARELAEASNVSEVCRRHGIAHTTGRTIAARLRAGEAKLTNEGIRYRTGHLTPFAESPAPPVAENVAADLESLRAAAAKPAVTPIDRASVFAAWGDDYDPAAEWRKAEEENDKHVQKAVERAKFTANLPNEPFGLAFVSDQHISIGNSVDMRGARRDAECIRDAPNMYALLGGDGVDNHIKHRSAVLAARSQPGEQWMLYEYYVSIIASKILVMISGNHDLWTNQLAGIDVVADLARRQRVHYAPDQAFIDCKAGSQSYSVGIRHQYRLGSSFNETHAPKQWYRNGEQTFDIGCVCHNHSPAIEQCLMHGIERVFVRPGAYQITSAYSRQFGYNVVQPTSPTVVCYPDRREMVPFATVQRAARFLRAELGR